MGARPPLTPRQADVLAALRAALAAGPLPPTLAELGAMVGLSSMQSIHAHVTALEAKGYLRRPRGYAGGTVGGSADASSRAYVLLDASGQAMPLPLRLPRLLRTPAVLRIDVPDTPAAPCGHPRTADNRWIVAGTKLCRTCGRDTLADHLARKAGGR